jgi:virginiamycin B lyase
MKKTTRYSISAAIVAALVVPALAQTLPDGEGKDAVQAICARCHDLSPITEGIGFSRDDWDAVIKSMIVMGANIPPQQAELIVNYLAKNFPPKKN